MSEGRSGGEPREPSENYEKALALHLDFLRGINSNTQEEDIRQALDDLGLKLAPADVPAP